MSDYKFPDEQDDDVKASQDDGVIAVSDDVEVEIVDDTPEKDRGRKPLDKDIADPTDDEIENYSDKVQARIKELTHARHDERRAKENLLRERQEMERLLQYMADENKKLKQTVNTGQEYVISSAKDSADAQLQAARRQLKDAQESFQKALRGLEVGAFGFGADSKDLWFTDRRPDDGEIMAKLSKPNADRVWYIRYAMLSGMTIDEIYNITVVYCALGGHLPI